MSISAAKREEIKRYLLKHINDRDKAYIAKVQEAYGISRTTAYHYVRQLAADGIIQPSSREGFPYELVSESHTFTYMTADCLTEDSIFNRDIAPLLQKLPKNIYDIWHYSFTEMMNNAIEHAQANVIACYVVQNRLLTDIMIVDDGVGIFQKIQDYFTRTLGTPITADEAVATLFAGKFTTDRQHHSGEGIFFTSRALDGFFIFSEGKIFAHTIFTDTMLPSDAIPHEKGTIVLMRQENQSNAKDLARIMDMYSDVERGFFKTKLPIAHIFPSGDPISRSEARRLGTMIVRFEEAALDFSGVERIGQAFTHELFKVFPAAHPDITLSVENASPDVQGMIDRVLNTK